MFFKIDTNKGSCNEARILDLQKRRIEEAYVEGSSQITYAVEEESSEQIATASDPRQLVSHLVTMEIMTTFVSYTKER